MRSVPFVISYVKICHGSFLIWIPAVLLCNLHDLIVFACDVPKIVPLVGKAAFAAVFYALFCIAEISAALVAQGIQRTVAEQAVEIFRVICLMAGEVFAVLMAEKCVLLSLPVFFFAHHSYPFYKFNRKGAGQPEASRPLCFLQPLRIGAHKFVFSHGAVKSLDMVI